MFGVERAFCGEDLRGTKRKGTIELALISTPLVCSRCVKEFVAIMREASAAS
jgi:hypothetical protein